MVKLARRVIEYKLRIGDQPEKKDDPVLSEKCGVFVTLNVHEKGAYGLRGCIGLPYPTSPLIDAVMEAAQSAAFSDPRFPPVQANEMSGLTVEISVLTPPERLNVPPEKLPEEVVVGRDGLIIGKGWKRGLLLPQVPVEWKWDSREFLSQCCRKAGLPENEWKKPGTEVYRFQAILFKEETPRGKVIRHIID